MSSSERPSPEPLPEEEASPAVLGGGGANSGNTLEASNALNYRAWGIPAVLSRGIPGKALRVFPGSFRNFSRISSGKSQPYWGYGPLLEFLAFSGPPEEDKGNISRFPIAKHHPKTSQEFLKTLGRLQYRRAQVDCNYTHSLINKCGINIPFRLHLHFSLLLEFPGCNRKWLDYTYTLEMTLTLLNSFRINFKKVHLHFS